MKIFLSLLAGFCPQKRTGKFRGEMAARLLDAGQAIGIVNASSHHPTWKVRGNFIARRCQQEGWQGVQVLHYPFYLHAKFSDSNRALLNFMLSSSLDSVEASVLAARRGPSRRSRNCQRPGALLIPKLIGALAWLQGERRLLQGLLCGKLVRAVVIGAESQLPVLQFRSLPFAAHARARD